MKKTVDSWTAVLQLSYETHITFKHERKCIHTITCMKVRTTMHLKELIGFVGFETSLNDEIGHHSTQLQAREVRILYFYD